MNRNEALDFLGVTEAAALACARWVGKGDRKAADQAACDAMRSLLNQLDMCGTIVIGEGERDEAPMLFIGEAVGSGEGPKVQIAVDPLEGTNLCANGTANAIAVLAAVIEGDGQLMNAPDCYMEKLVVGPECRGVVDITLPVRVNLRLMSKSLGKNIDELIVGVLDRERHAELIAEIRGAGARVHLVPDGDLSVAIATLNPDGGVDALMGTGGAPEGVITAAAVQCCGGDAGAAEVHHARTTRAVQEDDVGRLGPSSADRRSSLGRRNVCGDRSDERGSIEGRSLSPRIRGN